MNVSDFAQIGIQLDLTGGGRLKFSAPKGIMTPEILYQIRENKWALIQELAGQEAPLGQRVPAVTDQTNLMTGLTGRKTWGSVGSAGFVGYSIPSNEGRIDQGGGSIAFPYRRDFEKDRKRHIDHSSNKNNQLTLQSIRQEGPASVTGPGEPKGERDRNMVSPLGSGLYGDFGGEQTAGFIMRSGVLGGEVAVGCPRDRPDIFLIGGVVYRQAEIENLLSRNLDAENLRTVHEIKRVFEGTVCEDLLATA